jgi:hypothetical protein
MEVKVNFMSSIKNKLLTLSMSLILGTSAVFAETSANKVFNFSAFGKSSIAVDGVSAKATLTTDKSGYVAGDTVVVNADGFRKNELVSVSISDANSSLRESAALMQWNVYADENGRFTVNFPFDSLSSAYGRYIFSATGWKSKVSVETTITTALPNPSADIDQCANGPFSNPMPCTGANWQNGNVGQSQGHYYEGDSIPYRIKFDDLVIGSTNTVTIQWDTTQQGKHAIDYLTTYNRTEMVGNNPCSGIVPACGAMTTFPIPLDPNVTGLGISQIDGQVFTMWGGTITSVSAYTLSGTYAGNSATSITITFTADTANPVLAWSGHIADRNDWANLGGSASNISGSPYHMRLLGLNGQGGNQDRSLSNVAVRLNTRVIVIKDAQPNSDFLFPFTITGHSGFSLQDNGNNADGFADNSQFSYQLAQNTSQNVVVAESLNTAPYVLAGLNCVTTAPGTSTSMINTQTRSASITLNYGDTVTCTFINGIPTAASVSVSGKTLTSYGQPLARTRVTIQNASTGETQTTYTNTFGNYQFDGLLVGDFYIVSVANRKYVFEPSSQAFTLNDAVENLDFTTIP